MMRGARLLCLCVVVATSCTKLVDTDKTILADVGEEHIRLRDVMERISQTPPQGRLAANTAKGRAAILEDLISEMLLLQAADAAGITVSEAEIADRIQLEHETVQATGGAGGGETLLQQARDPATIARLLTIEKVVAPHVSEERARALYAQLPQGPEGLTVQYEFVSIRATNKAFAIDLERDLKQGRAIAQMLATYRSHPDFVNGGRMDPILVGFLAPWLQREVRNHKPGDVLPPWQTETAGEPTIQIIRLMRKWPHVPFELTTPILVQELYTRYLTELKAAADITRFPERLNLIDRR